MIRNATTADLPGIMAAGRRLQAKTPYKDIPEDIRTVAATMGECINSAFGLALVAEHKGKITGFMFAAAVPLWFSKKRSATDIVTYAETPGDGYKLIKWFVDWAWSLPNVTEVTMAQSSGIDTRRAGKLYERAGLVRVGSIYTAVREIAAAEVAA
jgi:hypothetical protein